MFNWLRKRERVIVVVTVDDLQVGDIFQYDPYMNVKVRRITELNPTERRLYLEKIPLNGHDGDVMTNTLYRNLKLFAWR